jgi:hypothetical protein
LENIEMAHLEILEGTWEELSAHAEQLKGRRLRLIVLPQEAGEAVNDEMTLREETMRLLAEADSLSREPGKPSSDPYKKAFGEMIDDKYRKMGLKL